MTLITQFKYELDEFRKREGDRADLLACRQDSRQEGHTLKAKNVLY